MTEIQQRLFSMQDEKFREFSSKLMPTVSPELVIGVRTPQLRSLAKELSKTPEGEAFISGLPHKYFEENNLHAFILAGMKDLGGLINEVNRFLPYVDNWATCDQMSPKLFKKRPPELYDEILNWLKSDKVYTVRFAVGMLMENYLDEGFSPEHPELVAELKSGEYYVDMMRAWYFATALAKRYDDVIPYIQERRLDVWTHNKAIQKAIESRRITPETKEYLKGLKVK